MPEILTDDEFEQFRRAGRQRRFERGQTVFRTGDVADSLYIIESGHVAVRTVTEDGDTVTFVILGPGDSFGELSLVGTRRVRSATVVTLDDTCTWALSRAQLQDLSRRELPVDRLLLGLLAAQVERLSAQLVEAMHVPVRPRVVRVLLRLCPRYDSERRPGGRTGLVELAVTQDDLAELVGASRPTVNQVLRMLSDAGALALRRGRISVLDQEVLARFQS